MKPLKILCCSFVFAASLPFPRGAISQDLASTHVTEADSENFTVLSYQTGPSASKVLKLCESLRDELNRVWGGKRPIGLWQPRCEVVVHSSQASYLRIVGPSGGQTKGSSFIQIDAGKVIGRRIDLLFDSQAGLTALPHELSHVVLADRFHGCQVPHWLDEGIAMLADTHHKQLLHARDCHDAIVSRTTFRIHDLLKLEQFTSAEQMPAFYGQSLSLIRMLVVDEAPEKIVDFGIDAIQIGYPAALRKHYAIHDVDELERRWAAFEARSPSANGNAPIVLVSFHP